MNIRAAAASDIDAVEAIYEKIHDMEERGETSTKWVRGVYPTRETATDALERGDLFVAENESEVVAAAIINKVQVEEYKNAAWEYDASPDEVMVLHTLVVDPDAGGRGFGRAFVSFYENYAKEHGARVLRMDTNVKNARARALYKSLGFREAGEVSSVFNGISGVMLVCLEKKLK